MIEKATAVAKKFVGLSQEEKQASAAVEKARLVLRDFKDARRACEVKLCGLFEDQRNNGKDPTRILLKDGKSEPVIVDVFSSYAEEHSIDILEGE